MGVLHICMVDPSLQEGMAVLEPRLIGFGEEGAHHHELYGLFISTRG